MVSKARTQSISLLMLLIVALSTTVSAIGEFRSHSLPAIYVADSDHAHSNYSDHTVDDNYSFQHDASNHNHTYDSATLKALNHFVTTRVVVSIYGRQTSGTPIHKPFQIERPPRLLLFT